MGGTAQLGGPTIGSDLTIGRDDVHTLPRRLQWNSLGGAGDCWRNHRHRPGHELPGPTRHAREWGLLPGHQWGHPSGHQWGPTAGHQWGLSRGHGHRMAARTEVLVVLLTRWRQ